jgi:hypothetical protein
MTAPLYKVVKGVQVEMNPVEAAEFLASQNVPDPAPTIISPRQARRQLRNWGIAKAQIQDFFAQITDEDARESAEEDWEYATEIHRDNPLIVAFGQHLGKSPQEMDEFFRQAATL